MSTRRRGGGGGGGGGFSEATVRAIILLQYG